MKIVFFSIEADALFRKSNILKGLRSLLYYNVLHLWENVSRLYESVGKRHSLYGVCKTGF